MSQSTYDFLVSVGDPETGIWCEGCALPAALRFPLTIIDNRGAGPLGTATGCPACRTGCFADR